MTQAQWAVLALKVSVVSGFIALISWVVVYSYIQPWWNDPIGRTLVTKTLLIAALLVPTSLSLFFHLSRTTSEAIGWVDVVLLGAVTPVMWWRTAVWLRMSGKWRKQGGRGGTHRVTPAEPGPGDAPPDEAD